MGSFNGIGQPCATCGPQTKILWPVENLITRRVFVLKEALNLDF